MNAAWSVMTYQKITCVPRNRCTEKNVMLCVYAKVLKKNLK